jgi:hypothetical protein
MVKFNLKLKDSKKYYRIKIFNTKALMYRYYIEQSIKEGRKGINNNRKFGIMPGFTYDLNPRFHAIVLSYQKYLICNGKINKKPENDIGEVLFYKDKIGAGIVAHELGHCAAFHQRILLKGKDLNLGTDNCNLEEQLFYDLTHLVRRFTNKCYQLNVYK